MVGNNPRPSTFDSGLPTYQADVSRSPFDFSTMEEFATAEKVRIVSAPPGVTKGSTPRATHGTTTVTEEISELPRQEVQPGGPLDTNLASNLKPRPHRKGVGKKMALFESPSIQQDTTVGIPGLAGFTTDDILVTGHNRPYRFSFYSNTLSATIHARNLSELPADGQTFEELLSGINISSGNKQLPDHRRHQIRIIPPPGAANRANPNPGSLDNNQRAPPDFAEEISMNNRNGLDGDNAFRGTDAKIGQPVGGIDSNISTWWLDVLNPTDEEMNMLSKVFSLHPLTTEDILMEETREKIELFWNYYFVCFRSFDQDPYSPTHLEPLNMYIIVFREGILSFHFRSTPHPRNVRHRIKQLKAYINVTPDWISYALIDDITDAFVPLVQNIEYEVDSIDELVLILKAPEQSDMLRRIGTCKKKVMGLSRLTGNKADVVKGLAKRCNDDWEVAPTADIGLYLSDIQEHLITMTQNLTHYERILSRSHSNYLAQISIEMTDANNHMNDVLAKLTALSTVLVPMNLVTGIWGMNVHVPGQNIPGYHWFAGILSFLATFAIVGGYAAYRLLVRKQ